MNHNIPDLTSKYEILLADVDRYLKVVREIEKKTNEFEKKINTTMEIGEHLELQKQISDIYSRINAELPNLSNKNNPPQN
jgi:Mg2+ and Co2+ transporter CorA